jgi:sn-glycerol 3-phosphate transport system substrate-binding protein
MTSTATQQSKETGGGARPSRRAFLAAGGAVGVAASAGCLGLPGESSGSGSGEDGFGEPGQMTASDGTGTINFWPAWGGYYEETIKSMVSEFESAHDDIEIDLNLLTNYRDSRTTAFTSIEGGKPTDMPDIAHFNAADSILARDTSWFQPIEELMSDVSPDDIIEPAAATSTLDGTMWGAPFYISNVVMHYNADMLAEAGYDPASPPASLAQVREMGETAVDRTGAEYGVTIPNAAWFLTCWIAEQEEFWMDEKNGHAGEPTTVFANKSYTLDVVDWWANLAADGLYFNGGIENWSEPTSIFRQARAPFNFNSSTSIAYVNSDQFDLRTAKLPTLNGERESVTTVVVRRYGQSTRPAPRRNARPYGSSSTSRSAPSSRRLSTRRAGTTPPTRDRGRFSSPRAGSRTTPDTRSRANRFRSGNGAPRTSAHRPARARRSPPKSRGR